MKTKKLITFILLFLINSTIKTEKMKLYAIYTPSHAILKDEWFLPSIQDDFDIVIKFHEQICPSGIFMSSGWAQTTIKKIELIIRAIEENWGKIFIFSDVDIQFFAPIQNKIEQLMGDNDMLIQRDNPKGTLCTGFFACRGNEKNLQLWKNAYVLMLNNKKIRDDQEALNICLNNPRNGKDKKNKYNVIWDYLPVIFFGGGSLTGYGWSAGKNWPIPENIVMHHANFTKGVENKIKQLKHVRDTVNARQNSIRFLYYQQ